MKKQSFYLISVLLLCLQNFCLKGQNTYDPYNTCTSTSRGVSSQNYTGEYHICFDPSSYYYQNFQANAITYKIENVSFPFTTNCLDCANPLSPHYSLTTRVLKMPDGDFTYDPINKKWVRDNSNLPGGGLAFGVNYDFELRNSYTSEFHTGAVNDFNFQNDPSDLVSAFFTINNPATQGYSFEIGNGQIFYPHSVLKHTFYFHNGPNITDKIVDSISVVLDHTRGRMRNYPFLNHNDGLNNGNPSTISNHDIAIPVDLIPGTNSLDNDYDNTVDNYPNCFSLSYPTINYFPFLVYDNVCSNHIPSSSNTSGPYLRPPTYSKIQAYIGNDHAEDQAGTILSTNVTEYGIKQEYIVDRPIDLNIINPLEKIIYNPSEVEINLALTGANQELVFPRGYTFKTVSGRYPSRSEVYASDPYNLHSHPEEIDVTTTLDPSCDSVGVVNDGIFSYYYVKAGSSLRIGDCVKLYDVKIIVEAGAHCYYNSGTVSGSNYSITGAASDITTNEPITMPDFENQCPCNCYDITKYDQPNINVTSSQTWDNTSISTLGLCTDGRFQIAGTLRVQAGNTLTINGPMKIEFGENGKIVVERGAKLITTGSSGNEVEFTSAEFCKQGMWAGMEVWGKRTENQGSPSQGLINLTYAKISNARNGIVTDNTSAYPNAWGYYGGIIKCDNVTFLNNRKSIAFLSYPNLVFYSSAGSYQEDNSSSYFKHCHFKIDNYLNDPQYKTADGRPFAGDAQVSMWDVKNVLFQNCDFINEVAHTDNGAPWYDSDTRGVGIYAIDAAVRLLGGASIGGGNYSTQNTFTGFSDAVRCISTPAASAMDFIWIDKNKFIDNVHGVTLEGTNFSQVNRNYFEIPTHEYNSNLAGNVALTRGFNKPTGLYLIGATNFIVQENEFYENSTISTETASDKYNYGIVVNNSTASFDFSTGDGSASGLV